MSFRYDRFFSVSLAAPIRRAVSGVPRLPVLMYHGITDAPEPHRSPYYKVNCSPSAFAEQMRALSKLGFYALDLESAMTRFEKNPTDRIVAVTFDDGYRDFYTEAFPILKKHGFRATMYLPTAYIGKERSTFNQMECLTWSEVHELRKAGMVFGSHTVTHPKLYELTWDKIEQEILESKKILDTELGESTASFAYPYAFPETDSAFVQRLETILKRANLKWCVTTRIGRVAPTDAPFTLKRLPMNGCDDPALLEAKLIGAYDWLALPQNLSKRLRRPRRRAELDSAPVAATE